MKIKDKEQHFIWIFHATLFHMLTCRREIVIQNEKTEKSLKARRSYLARDTEHEIETYGNSLRQNDLYNRLIHCTNN